MQVFNNKEVMKLVTLVTHCPTREKIFKGLRCFFSGERSIEWGGGSVNVSFW